VLHFPHCRTHENETEEKEQQQKMASTGGGGGEQQQQQQQQKQQQTPQHKQTVLDLGKYIDKGVRVKLSGGREVEGILKGFDQLLNLVLDETKEYLRDVDDPLRITDETRKLGLIVTRGTSVMVVSPLDGLKEIENPFAAAEEY
jgi:U6 snRNA-associated Sm-like protein LSm7